MPGFSRFRVIGLLPTLSRTICLEGNHMTSSHINSNQTGHSGQTGHSDQTGHSGQPGHLQSVSFSIPEHHSTESQTLELHTMTLSVVLLLLFDH